MILSLLNQVPETSCYISDPICDVSFRFQMKIISYHHKNHLLDDFQEVLKSYKKIRYF